MGHRDTHGCLVPESTGTSEATPMAQSCPMQRKPHSKPGLEGPKGLIPTLQGTPRDLSEDPAHGSAPSPPPPPSRHRLPYGGRTSAPSRWLWSKRILWGKKCVDCPVTRELQSIQMEDLRYSQMERPGDVQLVARPFQHVLHPCSHEQVGYKQVRGSSTWWQARQRWGS